MNTATDCLSETPEIEATASVSTLRKDVAQRKARKQRLKQEILNEQLAKRPMTWGDTYEFVNLLQGSLVDYGSVAVSANNALTIINADPNHVVIDAVELQSFAASISSLFEDITHFSTKLNFIRAKIPGGDTDLVTMDSSAEYYALFMELDELRVDVTTVAADAAVVLATQTSTLIAQFKAGAIANEH